MIFNVPVHGQVKYIVGITAWHAPLNTLGNPENKYSFNVLMWVGVLIIRILCIIGKILKIVSVLLICPVKSVFICLS